MLFEETKNNYEFKCNQLVIQYFLNYFIVYLIFFFLKKDLEPVEIPQVKLEKELTSANIELYCSLKDESKLTNIYIFFILYSLIIGFVNLCDVLIQIIHDKTSSSRFKFIPVLKATNNQIRQLDNYIKQQKLTVNFIRYGSRLEYKYFDGKVEMKEKGKNYKFSNAVGVDFKGRRFQINLSQMKIVGESSFSTDLDIF